VEVDRSHPLSTLLLDLGRIPTLERMHLRGLSVDEVQRLLASTIWQPIPRTIAELVQARTEGNPQFIGEIWRLAVAEGLLERKDGLRDLPGVGMLGIPESLREVVRNQATLGRNALRRHVSPSRHQP
jgi:predicted ATPase